MAAAAFVRTLRILPVALLCAAGARAQGTLRVVAPRTVLRAGERVPLRAERLGAAVPCVWSLPEGEGAITAEGVFTAPSLEASRLVAVRATAGGATGQASLLVLRDDTRINQMHFLVGHCQGPEVWRPWSAEGLPFQGAVEAPRACGPQEGLLPDRQLLGCGLTVTLSWDRRHADADGLLLSIREGEDLRRHTVTGQPAQVVQATGRISGASLEILRAPGPAGGGWESTLLPLNLQVRGLVPLAGNPVAEPGHQDGRGLEARFRKPCGLAMLGSATEGTLRCVAADPEDHVLRTIAPDGTTGTLCGGPGVPGYVDGTSAMARFNRPTFVAARDPETFVVADSGNHAIRRVDAQGNVHTLAGAGVPGWVDSEDPSEARFHDPQGVALDLDGNVYVADAGNYLIRKVDTRGRVTTIAGTGAQGGEDGPAATASFSRLRGLAVFRNILCIADGHSLRGISLDPRLGGMVGTILGSPEAPGTKIGGLLALDRHEGPALNEPCGLAAFRNKLLVADEGNHAVRVLYQEPLYFTFQCHAVAGDPADGALRWGLLRDGLPWRPPEAYAALEAPRGVTFSGNGGIYVATGRCVVQLSESEAAMPPPVLRGERDHEEGEELEIKAGRSYPLHFLGPHYLVQGGTARPYRLTLERLDRDTGEPYSELLGYGPDHHEVVFPREGRVETRLLALTPEGVSFGCRRFLRVIR